MNPEFAYRRIGQDFLDELATLIRNGESVVLLGPGDSGKRYALHRIPQRIEQFGIVSVSVELMSKQSLDTSQAVALALKTAVEEAVIRADLPAPAESPSDSDTALVDVGAMMEAVDELYLRLGRPYVLIAANVDCLPHHLARRFLQGLRTRVESDRLRVVLSGENDLRSLVHGPKSEFTCAGLFVVQGFDRSEFDTYFNARVQVLGLPMEKNGAARDHLYDFTGGSIHLLRPLLWAYLDEKARAFRRVAPSEKEDWIEEIMRCYERSELLDTFGVEPFTNMMRAIQQEVDSIAVLQQLIEGRIVCVGGTLPYPLELAGVVVRDLASGTLRFASTMVQHFIGRVFGTRRRGDLHARHGRWPDAFACFAQLSPDEKLRPVDIDDRSPAMATIYALGSALFAAATKESADSDPREKLKVLFTEGCLHILGFREVSYWRWSKKDQWKHLGPGEPSLPLAKAAPNCLPGDAGAAPGWRPLPPPWENAAAVGMFRAVRSDEREAVIVSDFGSDIVISRERGELARHLIDQFARAYSHAAAVVADRQRLEARKNYTEILSSIFETIGRNIVDVHTAICTAAVGLRRLGYRRALFCLVDPTGKYIVGEKDDCEDTRIDLAAATNYPLSEPKADIQPHVIATKEPVVILWAMEHDLVNKDVAGPTGMESLALVPILNWVGSAIGTIHVEREDRAVPSPEEVEDLLTFGRQLAIALEHTERVNLLKSALDRLREPLVITDRLLRVRYANKPATEWFGVPNDWQEKQDAVDLAKFLKGEALDNLRISIDKGGTEQSRTARHVRVPTKRGEIRCEVLSDGFGDYRGRSVGGLLHIMDVDYLLRVFDAFELVAEAKDIEDAIMRMLRATEQLGHPWGRIYLATKRDDHEVLTSHACYGMVDSEIERSFKAAEFVLPKNDAVAQKETWRSIFEKKPLVFSYNPKDRDDAPFHTSRGLEFFNVPDPLLKVLKKVGDYWLDIPLLTRDRSLGKISIGCREDFPPEDFELIKVLSVMVNGFLEALDARNRALEKKQAWIEAAADRAIGDISHNLVAQLAALPLRLEIYRTQEAACPGLRALNEQFERVLHNALATAERTKQGYAPLVAQPKPIDVRHFLEDLLSDHLSTDESTLKAPADPIIADFDSKLVGGAIVELIRNSRRAVLPSRKLEVTIHSGLAAGRGEPFLEIRFEDNGPGIPDEFKQRVFENFFTRWPGHAGQSGLGIGLAYVRRVCQAHGGTVVEQGIPGHGVAFVLRLPLHASLAQPVT